MKKLAALLMLYVVCSNDGGLTRTVYRDARNVFFKGNCLAWQHDKSIDGEYTGACRPDDECVVKEGVVPPAGSPSDDYLEQESTETVKQ